MYMYMWMDSDAIIKKQDISIDSIVNSYNSDIFIAIVIMFKIFNY